MRRVSRLIGTAIVAADSGGKIGRVADVLLDPERGSIVALVVRNGLLRDERVLPFAEIGALGEDAVVVRSAVGVLDASEWRSKGLDTRRSKTLKGRPVITTDGNRIGEVQDIFVDEQTGALAHLEIQSPDFAGLLVRRSRLPVSRHVRIGRDVILIPQPTAETTGPPGQVEGRTPPRTGREIA